MDVFQILTSAGYSDELAGKLADSFKEASITEVSQVDNAPLLLKATHGADIYAVIAILKSPPAPPKKKAYVPKRKRDLEERKE